MARLLTSISYAKKYFENVFHVVCLFCTLGLISMCLHEYNKNEDTAHINYKKFHGSQDAIYPSVTLCLNSIRFHFTDEALLTDDYSLLIQGFPVERSNSNKTIKDYIDIDYDSVSPKLSDLLSSAAFNYMNIDENSNTMERYLVKNESLILDHLSDMEVFKSDRNLRILKSYVSYRGATRKCFTIDIPFVQNMNIDNVQFDINGSSFYSGKVHTHEIDISFGYPQQFLESFRKNKVIFDETKTLGGKMCYLVNVFVGSIEVVKRRNKKENQCNEDWENHDMWVWNQLIQRVGCNPKYLKVPSNLPTCSKSQQYEDIKKEMKFMKGIQPPCKSIEKLSQLMLEEDLGMMCAFMPGSHSQLTLRINFNRETTYKEVQLIQAYNFQSLIGNAGGYVGLLVGYSVSQAPDLIMRLLLGTKYLLEKLS